jgi:large subunit ribosomal protein L17
MRHAKQNKRFGRNSSQRKQLINSLVRSLFVSYRIKTTLEKAKESRKLAEKLITLAKSKSLSDIRSIDKVLQDRALTKKLVSVIAPLFKERKSGYTRYTRCGFRKGDGASLAVLELTDMPVIEKKPKKQKKQKQDKKEQKADIEEKQPSEKTLPEDVKPAKKKEKKAQKKVELKPKEEKPKEKDQKPKEEERPLPPKKQGLFDGIKRLFGKDKDKKDK